MLEVHKLVSVEGQRVTLWYSLCCKGHPISEAERDRNGCYDYRVLRMTERAYEMLMKSPVLFTLEMVDEFVVDTVAKRG
jgi:hypothetical protein